MAHDRQLVFFFQAARAERIALLTHETARLHHPVCRRDQLVVSGTTAQGEAVERAIPPRKATGAPECE